VAGSRRFTILGLAVARQFWWYTMHSEAPAGMRLCASARISFDVKVEDPASTALGELLTRQLGERPRRLGVFAQLALAGALECRERVRALAAEIPSDTAMLLTSEFAVWMELAPRLASFNVNDQAPTPYEFLAVQGNSACLAVAQRLGIAGEVLLLASDDESRDMVVATLASDSPGLLLGRVEIGECEWISEWDYFRRDA
jgi:hypothetical protein